jgi:tRNA(adenine34) deaminase
MTVSASAIHTDWMQHALRLASQAAAIGEVPVGAVLVHQGQMIGSGYNQPISSHDPTAHAEIVALRDACQRLKNYRLPDNTTLYVTLEPCTQCVGALVHARVTQVVYAATEPRAGSLVSARQLMQAGFFNHYFSYEGGILAEESRQILQDFFRQRRQKAKTSQHLIDQP